MKWLKGWRKKGNDTANITFNYNSWICNKCNKKYRTKNLLKQHNRRVHDEKP